MVTLCFTFPLIFLGGLVTSNHAGMSVPDWPNSYGYNMFLFPPSRWTGGILYEHTHRLLGTVVGFCACVLTAAAWGPARTARGRRAGLRLAVGFELLNAAGTGLMLAVPDLFHLPATARRPGVILPQGAVGAVVILLVAAVAWACRTREPRRWVRWLATSCLIAVCAQGLLGGLRVDLINLPLAIVHGCFAQATFCLMVVTAAVTGRAWSDLSGRRAGRVGGPLLTVACATVAIVYAQLIVAAVMRHLGAGLAIPELIFPYGHVLPPTDAAGLAAANHDRIWTWHLPPVRSLGPVWLAYAHRCGAVVVMAAIATLVAVVYRTAPQSRLTRPAIALAGLVVSQVTLGLLTVHYRKAADVASTHVACGALVLATSVLIAVRSARLYVLAPRGRPAAIVADDAELVAV